MPTPSEDLEILVRDPDWWREQDAVTLMAIVNDRRASIKRLLTITSKIRITMPLTWHNWDHSIVSLYRLIAPDLLRRT